MTNVEITPLTAAPLYTLEIWSNVPAVANRFETANGFTLPPMGRSAGSDMLRLIRFEPTVWLVEGNVSSLPNILEEDGAITAIGGGVIRVRLSGKNWRMLLMEGGMFDAENPSFVAGCSAATIIDHVGVRLHVVADDICDAYVPLSYTKGLIAFWTHAAKALVS